MPMTEETVRLALVEVDQNTGAHFQIDHVDPKPETRFALDVPLDSWVLMQRPGFLHVTVQPCNPYGVLIHQDEGGC